MPIDWTRVSTRPAAPFKSKEEARLLAAQASRQVPVVAPATAAKVLRSLNRDRAMAGLEPLDRLAGVGVVVKAQRTPEPRLSAHGRGEAHVLVDSERLANQIQGLTSEPEWSGEPPMTKRVAVEDVPPADGAFAAFRRAARIDVPPAKRRRR